ncbi:hypothetical protein NDN08_007592 [Rhodosorus marinus]|uniref:MsrB domain-containing protein n=1 Tax=Rhodosorus marinus TaxID=101924 RepID=A0AAV8V3M4_9RHOD|nr:hypothetical protein NDN08_007592 [Rhodosorus marinus]
MGLRGLGGRRRSKGLDKEAQQGQETKGADELEEVEQVECVDSELAEGVEKVDVHDSVEDFDEVVLLAPVKVYSNVQSRQLGVDWHALEGDKGFRVKFALDRETLNSVRSLVDEIDVPRDELQWHEKVGLSYKYMRKHKMEAQYSGKYCIFATVPPEDGIFRCRGCSNFLFSNRMIVKCRSPYVSFHDSFPGALMESTHPRAHGYDVDCSICLSFIGREEPDTGNFQVNSASTYFQPLQRREIGMLSKMCNNRWRLLSA